MKTNRNHQEKNTKNSKQQFLNEAKIHAPNQQLAVAEVLMSREETKEYLSISFPTLRKWSKDGTLKCYQLGGRVYYKLHEILDALIRVE